MMASSGVNELIQWNMSNNLPDKRWTTHSGLVISQRVSESREPAKNSQRPCSRWKSSTSKRNKEMNTSKDENTNKKSKLEVSSSNVDKLLVPHWQEGSMITYKITVRTGKFEGAGTTAPVYIQMKGVLGEKTIKKRLVDKRHLDKKSNQMKFSAGSIIAFRHQNKDIGEIHSIKIDIDQVYEDECWYCESILVKNKTNGAQWKFPCNQWLGFNKEPGETFCILYHENEEEITNTYYQITTVTGSEKNSHGTTKVLMTFYSSSADTGTITLDKKRSSTFQKSQTDIFTVEARELFEIVKVRVRLPEDDPTAKDWFLERIVIKIQSKPDVAFFAACSNWISQFGMPTDLNVSTDPLKCIRNNRFRLTFFTGDSTGSGTSADVFVNLLGTSNRSDDIRLSNDGISFRKGAVAEFDIETTFLGGTLRQLSVSHDSSGTEPEWFLEKVIVDQLDCPKRVYEFVCHRWLSAERGDGQTSCSLLPVGFDADVDETDFSDLQDENKNTFELRIRVSGDSNPKKSATCIYIVLYGEEQCGDSDKFIQISTGKLLIKGNFQCSQTVEEKLLANNPSPVTQISLGLKDEDEEVLIEDITVYCTNTCIEQYFRLNRWLSSSQDGELTERVLYERIDRRSLRKPKIEWDVILTAKKDIPIKGSVNFIFWGEEGCCEMIFNKKPDAEERAMFKLDDVGLFYKVTSEFIPDESTEEMFLKRIQLSRRNSKESFTFDIKRWFSGLKEPFYTLTTDSPAWSSFHESAAALPVDRYNIVIKTSSEKGAATTAQVSLALVGETSDSGCRKLFPSSNPAQKLFQEGNEDCFAFECVNLGPVDHIILSHDGGDADEHDWLVEEIRITCDEREEDLKFPCGRWLSVNKHDCQTRMTLYPDSHKQFALCRDYVVQVNTADIQGTEEDITAAFVILNGKNQSSDKLLLTQSATHFRSSGLFKQGQSSAFSFRTPDLGEIQSILIGHASETKKWFVDKIFVSCEQRCEKTEFSCQRWLARSEGDGKVEVECLPSEIILGIPKTDYTLTVETGEHGTEGQVLVTICGSRGQTKETSLRKSTNNFLSGATDVFTFLDIDVGQIGKIRVKYVASEKETWDLKSILLSRGKPVQIERSEGQFWTDKGVSVKYLFDNRKPIDLKTTKIDLDYNFVCDQLFRISTERPTPIQEFVPHDNKGRPKIKDWKVPYTVNIKTSQESQVVKQDMNKFYLNIIGSRGDTGLRCLGGKIPHPEKESSLEIDTVGIGTPEKLQILFEKSTKCKIFSLELIANKKEFFFPADTSFDLQVAGSQLNHMLIPINKRLIENVLKKGKTKETKNWRLRDTFGLEMLRGKVIYTVRTFTGNKKFESSPTKNIYMVLHGNYGSSEKFTLHDSRLHSEAFKKNETDEFDLETTDLGIINQITVGCDSDNSEDFKEFQLEKIEVRAGQFGSQWCFVEVVNQEQSHNELTHAIKQFECINSLTKSFEPFLNYEIKIKTSSDVPAASTNANVFIQLYGDKAKSEILHLVTRKGLREAYFNQGSTDIFIRELENVGDSIKKIRIGHDNSGMKPGWHLAWVEIRVLLSEYKSRVFRFECNRWLARDEDDKATERELNPKEVFIIKYDSEGKQERVDEVVERGSLKNYTVHVYTGDVPGAGTDANVFLTLYGDNGDSGERALKHSDNNINKFEQNDHDVFTIEASDLGSLYKLIIRHDNKGAVGAAWFLDRIEVTENGNSSPSSFFCERWLSKSNDDQKIERTLYAQGYHGKLLGEPDYSLEGFTTYIVRVHTGIEKDMGTDASAFIAIFGSDGSTTGKMPLEHVIRSKFDPATSEEFHLWAPDVGKALRRIDVSHDGLLASQSWFIETIEIDCPTLGKNYVFKIRSWVGVSREGSRPEKSLAVSDSETVNYLPKVPHLLNIFTGDHFQAGTDCEIQIILFGKRGTSEPTIIPKNENRFERGRRDLILFNCEDVGPLLKLRVQIRKNGFRKKWFLAKITLLAMNKTGYSNDTVEFVHKSWFDLKEGISSADIVAQINGKKMLKETDYEVSVTTSSIKGSGTDANVSMIIFGECGYSEELQLLKSKTNTNKFEKSQTDVFDFHKMLDLGNIIKTRIWHDNSGMLASWHVKEILVENKMDGKRYKITCNKWLSRSEDDKQTSREFFVDGFKRSQDDREQAKFRAILIFDSSGGTNSSFRGGSLILQIKSNNRSTDHTTVELDSLRVEQKRLEADFVATNLQNLTGITLKFEPKQSGDYVHLKSVCILNLHTKMTSFIEVDKKLPSKPNEPVFVDYHPDTKEVDFLSKLGVSLQMTYEIRVFTGDKSGAGTDSNVFITIFGTRGDSGKHKLADSREHINKFERNYLDTFDFKFSDLGELKKVIIEHDNWGQGSAWYLERIEIVDIIRKTVNVFPCDKWLDKAKGDRQICRELYSRQRKPLDEF